MVEHGGNVHRFSRILNKDISEILDFSANINPLGFPKGLKEYLYSMLDRLVYYPDPDYAELREEIGKYIGMNLENIIVGNGAIEIISLCIQTIGRSAVIPVPTFSEYARICKINDLEVEYFYNRRDFVLDIDILISRLKSGKYGMLILCNPNNPTGRLLEISIIRFLLEETTKLDIFILLDEAFIEFTEDYPTHSAISLINSFPNLCVVRCFTKFFGIPGMRLGYGVASEEFINRMKDKILPWSVNILADLAGRYVLKDKIFMEQTRKLIDSERRFLLEELSSINWLHPYPSQANFILVKVDVDTSILGNYLLEKGILIRKCGNFEGLDESYIRLAIKDHSSNARLIEALKNFSGL